MTYQDKASYGSSPPCITMCIFLCTLCKSTFRAMFLSRHPCAWFCIAMGVSLCAVTLSLFLCQSTFRRYACISLSIWIFPPWESQQLNMYFVAMCWSTEIAHSDTSLFARRSLFKYHVWIWISLFALNVYIQIARYEYLYMDFHAYLYTDIDSSIYI